MLDTNRSFTKDTTSISNWFGFDLGYTATRLGDFRSSKAYMDALSNNKTTSATDYTYDVAGNLKTDKNKDITAMRYNYLNLPDSIVITGKGIIKYQYDAAGNKTKKTVIEGAKTTTTLYLGSAVFRNDTLEFIAHEEGRIRKTDTLVYDYMLKDHLGNVRMVLTTEKQTGAYPVASLETASLPNEKLYYSGLDTGRVNKNTVSGYPNDTYTDPNDFIQKLNGNGAKTGAGIVLKVMAGDKFNIRANSWYKKNGATPGSPANPLVDLVAALAGSVGSISAAHGGATATELTSSDVFTPGATNFLASQTVGTGKPKAYVNWVLFDEQFKLVSSSSGFDGAGNDQELKPHLLENKPIHKNGYLYVYVSNATPNIDVFFDNLQVTHIRGPMLEETHYYPFGLTMAGISSKALTFGEPENKKKYNGIEKEDALGIDIYDAQFRELDQQTGRWWQIDPAIENMEMWSPYVSNYDNPITYMDPLGDEPEDGDGCCKGLVKAIVQTTKDVITFGVGAANALATNQWGGAGRGNPSSYSDPHDAAVSQAGQTFGDMLTIGGSIVATGLSVVAEGGTLGFASPAVVPLLTQQWAVATPTAIKNIANDLSGGSKANATSNSSSGKGTQNPKVKKAVDKGNSAHKDFSQKAKDKGWTVTPSLKDPKTGKTVKPDAVTPSGKPVELKPNTASGKAKGAKQLPKYERATGQKGRVVTYDPNKY